MVLGHVHSTGSRSGSSGRRLRGRSRRLRLSGGWRLRLLVVLRLLPLLLLVGRGLLLLLSGRLLHLSRWGGLLGSRRGGSHLRGRLVRKRLLGVGSLQQRAKAGGCAAVKANKGQTA